MNSGGKKEETTIDTLLGEASAHAQHSMEDFNDRTFHAIEEIENLQRKTIQLLPLVKYLSQKYDDLFEGQGEDAAVRNKSAFKDNLENIRREIQDFKISLEGKFDALYALSQILETTKEAIERCDFTLDSLEHDVDNSLDAMDDILKIPTIREEIQELIF